MKATELDLGTLRLKAENGNFTFHLSQLAYDRTGEIYLASVVGAASAVKAFRASLAAGGKVAIEASDFTGCYSTRYLRPHREAGGYKTVSRLLGFNTWHLLAVSRREEFLVNAKPASVWAKLNGPDYSTPLLREWTGYVIGKLEEAGKIAELECFQCSAALLSATTEDLDEVVSEGLRSGRIRIPEAA